MNPRFRLTIDYSDERLVRAFRQFDASRVRRALTTAVNDTTRQLQSFTIKVIARESGIKSGTVRPRVPRTRAVGSNPTARVTGFGRPFGLISFQARQTRAGVTARPWGKRRLFPGTFIATLPGGAQQVMTRIGRSRLPIRRLYGPGVAQTLNRPEVLAEVETYGSERLDVNINRQIQRLAFSVARGR